MAGSSEGGQLVFIPSGKTNIFWKELGNQPTNQNKTKQKLVDIEILVRKKGNLYIPQQRHFV
jgi:hypothetical protein